MIISEAGRECCCGARRMVCSWVRGLGLYFGYPKRERGKGLSKEHFPYIIFHFSFVIDKQAQAIYEAEFPSLWEGNSMTNEKCEMIYGKCCLTSYPRADACILFFLG